MVRGSNSFFASHRGIIFTGVTIGIIAVLLQYLGNPANMGVCVACFTRDMAGAVGLHRAAAVQYIRPEIIGFVMGAFIAALVAGEWKPRGGSAPLVRFALGVFAMIGALVFLGCPWRDLLRMAGGDLNALVGFAGLVAGVIAGAAFLKRGYTLGRAQPLPRIVGLVFPGIMLLLLALVLMRTSFMDEQAIFFTPEGKGPGGSHAVVIISLAAGLLIGAIAQRSRFCTIGSIRDVALIRNFHLMWGVVALLAAAFVGNLFFGLFHVGWAGMPIAHSNSLWNFLGMVLAGMAFVMGGGCPGRQCFLAGEGDTDAALFWTGMFVGAGFAHNWFLASVPDRVADGIVTVGGPGPYGKIAVIAGIAFCALLGFFARERGAAPNLKCRADG